MVFFVKRQIRIDNIPRFAYLLTYPKGFIAYKKLDIDSRVFFLSLEKDNDMFLIMN